MRPATKRTSRKPVPSSKPRKASPKREIARELAARSADRAMAAVEDVVWLALRVGEGDDPNDQRHRVARITRALDALYLMRSNADLLANHAGVQS